MPSNKRSFGDIGETEAAKFLVEREYEIICRNYSKPWGEIDIVAKKDGVIRFIEVKTSKYHPNPSFTPEIRVNKRKIRSLKRICETYLSERKLQADKGWQIDVISVILNEDNSLFYVNHIKNAVFEKQY